MDPRRALLVHGRTQPPRRPAVLRAGPLTVEWWDGDLRNLRYGSHELIRRVYFALRDESWATVPFALEEVVLDAEPQSFAIEFTARHDRPPHRMTWRATIRGSSEGEVRFAIEGRAEQSFVANRVGFCLLHPAEAAGRPCSVTHVDGSVQDGRFPEAIAPHQPFCDIRGVRHEVAPGVWCEADLAGDTFEMEDQRNWSDASFKTYCTPLHLSVGATYDRGQTVRQEVVVRSVAKDEPQAQEDLVALGEPIRPFPVARIGLAYREGGKRDADRLRRCGIAFLRVELTDRDDLAILAAATETAATAGIPLELAIRHRLADRGADIARAARAAKVRGVTILSEGPTTDPEDFLVARQRLQPCFPEARWGAGSRFQFTELNRQPPSPRRLDYVAYPVHAQVHAFENVDVMETARTHGAQVRTARALFSEQAVAVGPISIGPREDPRRGSLVEAVWTIASLLSLSEAGAVTACYDADLTTNGEPTPLAAALEALAGSREWATVPTSDPLRVAAFRTAGEPPSLWVANLSSWDVHIDLPDRVLTGTLDESDPRAFVRVAATGEETRRLAPYAFSCFLSTPPERLR